MLFAITSLSHAQQAPDCEGLGLDDRAMGLCQSWFVAYGCGGGLQREELRCHRLGQEFEHQTGIPYRLLPGLAGNTSIFDSHGGQLNLGEFLELRLPPDVLEQEVRVSLRLTPSSVGPALDEKVEGERGLFDIRLRTRPAAPAFGKRLSLELDPVPFLKAMGADRGDAGIRLLALPARDAPVPLQPVSMEGGRLLVTLPAALFATDATQAEDGVELLILLLVTGAGDAGAPRGAPGGATGE